MPKLRLLVLAVGTQVGQNILATLARRREGLVLMATSSVANEPAVFDYDTVYLVPETGRARQAFEAALLDIIEREAIDLVIPCRDDDVALLAELRERRPDLAPRLLSGSPEGARVIGDKWLSYRFSVEHDLPFAACMIHGSHDPAAFVRESGLPLIAKPRRGYAGIDVRLVLNEAQLAAALEREDTVVQEFLGDTGLMARTLADFDTNGFPLYHSFEELKHSVQALIAPDGSVAHVICTRNVRYMRRSKWVEPDPDPVPREIGERCARAFAAIGWRGPLNIQCQRDRSGEIRIHEYNGRFTGGTIDRWLLGFDEVGAAIERFTGRSMPSERAPVPAALEAFQSLVARAADPRHVERLSRERVWTRQP